MEDKSDQCAVQRCAALDADLLEARSRLQLAFVEDLGCEGTDIRVQGIACAILSDDESVSIDRRGRLIVVDDSPISLPKDQDGDGFEETIVIGLADAGRIVAKDSQAFYDSVRAKVGEWQLTIWPKQGPNTGLATPPAPTEPQHWASQDKEAVTAPPVLPPEFPKAPETEPAEPSLPTEVVADGQGIKLAIGRLEKAFYPKDVELFISDTRLNNLNMGVVGDLGTARRSF